MPQISINALNGATFISTKRSIMQKAIHLRLCQCPERGGLHFYEEKYDYALKQLLCVNALKGATFISTLRWMNEISPATIVSMP